MSLYIVVIFKCAHIFYFSAELQERIKNQTIIKSTRPPKFNTVYQAFFKKFPVIGKSVILLDFSRTVKAATLIFISGRGSVISSAKEGESGFIYYLVKS